jgi:hypothetical protein
MSWRKLRVSVNLFPYPKGYLTYSLVSNEYVVHVKKLLRDAALDRMRLEKEKVSFQQCFLQALTGFLGR